MADLLTCLCIIICDAALAYARWRTYPVLPAPRGPYAALAVLTTVLVLAAAQTHPLFAVFPTFLTLCVSGVFVLVATDNASLRTEIAATDHALTALHAALDRIDPEEN